MFKFLKKKSSSSSPEPGGKSNGTGDSNLPLLEQLRDAVESNNLPQVKKLVSANPSISSAPIDELGQTCLHLAATIGNVDCVEMLLKYCDPNVNDSSANTALHFAVAHPDLVKLLLRKKSVDVNRLAVQRNSILHLLAKRLTPIDDEMWNMLKKVRLSFKITQNSPQAEETSPSKAAFRPPHGFSAILRGNIRSSPTHLQQERRNRAPFIAWRRQHARFLVKLITRPTFFSRLAKGPLKKSAPALCRRQLPALPSHLLRC